VNTSLEGTAMADRTILIVDDTPDHRDLLRLLLQAVGYRVITAPSAEAAARAQHEPPDLILAELSLPGQAAWETARALRAMPTLAHTPILGTTVYNTLIHTARAEAIGCAGYVEKPFNIDYLLHRIDQLLPATLSA
jgi:CheY-like chemotaxis protein